MRKKVITIQLDPMVLAQVWQYGKDQGLAKQVAIEALIVKGLKYQKHLYTLYNEEV